MKLSKLLIVIIIFSSVFFAVSIQKSFYSPRRSSVNAMDFLKSISAKPGEALPLKNQLSFLLLTGASLGLKYLVDANKKLKTQKL